MKQRTKRSFALLLAMAMVFSLAGVFGGCGEEEHVCGHVCPTCQKCLDETCTDPVCAEKCEGHTAVEPHECGHVCPTCGKCLDETCTDPVCAEKCEGHQQDVDPDKGLTKENPLTPDEAIILMDKAGDGKVVNATNKDGYYIRGVVNAGSTVDTQYNEWTFKLAAGTKVVSCKAKIDNSVTNKPASTNGALDGSTVIIKGFLELYNGWYQCSYLPASVSPTGAKFTPSIVSIETSVAEVESITLDHTEDMVLLASHANKYMSVKATVQPANAPQDVTWSISENTAGITVTATGSIQWTETEGEATVTATATGTDKTASVKVKVQNVNGSTEDDPLTVDEALALMTEDGEVFAGYAASKAQGFYLTGKAENSKYFSRTVNSYWTFEMAGTNGTKLSCTAYNFSGVSGTDGNLDDYTIVMRNVTLKKTGTTYTAGSVANRAIGVSSEAPQKPVVQGKAEYDFTNWMTDSTPEVVTTFKRPGVTTEMLTTVNNNWAKGQTEITSLIMTAGMKLQNNQNGGWMYDAATAKVNSTVTIQTQHQIKKVTFRVISAAASATNKFTVNGQSFTKTLSGDALTGKKGSDSDYTAEFTFDMPTNTITFEALYEAGVSNQFVVVGFTFEWDEEATD